MGGLIDALYIGRSAVDAARAGVELTSHNISNVNTAGFHRRRLVTSPVSPPPVLGGGVQVDGGPRVADQLLERRLAAGLGMESRAAAREALLSRVEASAADTSESGIGAAISELLAKFSALGSAPQDSALRSEVLAAANRLASTFNRIAAELEEVASDADSSIAAQLPEINAKAASIAELNAKIIEAEASGHEAGDLRDQRDLLVQDLASLTGATSFTDGNGMVTVLVGGHTLVQAGEAAALEAVPDAALGNRNRIDLVQGAVRIDITARAPGGTLGGLLSVRDGTVPEVLARVDQLAYDLATAINTQHRSGFGLDAVGGRNLFAPLAAVTGAAAALSLRTGITADELAASGAAAGVPGNGENALALAGLGSSPLAAGGTQTFTGEAANLVAAVGSASAAAIHEAEVARDQVTAVRSQQSSASGVSLDEEMMQLVQYQRAYQAGAKVLTVVDELIRSLMSI